MDADLPGTVPEPEDHTAEMQQQLDDLGEIKAKTMYRMVEEVVVRDRVRKLLFLTNKQAALLTHTRGSVRRILDALDISKPKLVVNFLPSLGAWNWCEVAQTDDLDADEGWNPAWFTHPWESFEQGQEAEQRLEQFMLEVLIPLAVETNAVIICDALQDTCMLTNAFCNAMSLCRARWPDSKLPFTLIGFTCEMAPLCRNEDHNAFWQGLCRGSSAWKTRKAQLLQRTLDTEAEHGQDLNPLIEHFVIGDSLDEQTGQMEEKQPFSHFMTHMTRELSSRLPSFCLKTGMATSIPGDDSNCTALVRALESGMPVVLLDARTRHFEGTTRSEMIEVCWKSFEETCDRLVALGSFDNFDMMALSYFHAVLFGDGTHEIRRSQDTNEMVPLFEAIERSSREGVNALTQVTSTEEAHALVSKFASRLFADAFHRAQEADAVAAQQLGSSAEQLLYLGARKHLYVRDLKYIITHQNLHATNVSDIGAAAELVRQIIHRDRVPKRDVHEGLLLLREAWDEYDIAMCLAEKYKVRSKVLYLVVLFLGISTVLCTVLRSEARVQSACENDQAGSCDAIWLAGQEEVFKWIVFSLTLTSGVALTLTSLLNPSLRWRQLRSSAGILQSITWLYRSRVGEFSTSAVNRLSSQQNFTAALQRWREELVAGSDLQTTSMERKYKKHVYKHMQRAECPLHRGEDDFHSPVKPQEYVELRLVPAAEFFRGRIPRATNTRFIMQLLVILCSAVCAVLTQLQGQAAAFVAVIAVASGSLTSWLEFADLGQKVERYNNTVREIKNLLSWWRTLDGVEKANIDNIQHLIHTGEAILTNELRAWSQSGVSKEKRNQDSAQSDDEEQEIGRAMQK